MCALPDIYVASDTARIIDDEGRGIVHVNNWRGKRSIYHCLTIAMEVKFTTDQESIVYDQTAAIDVRRAGNIEIRVRNEGAAPAKGKVSE